MNERSDAKAKKLRSSIVHAGDTQKTSPRTIKKNLEKIQEHVFDIRKFIISFLILGSVVLLFISFLILTQRNSIEVREITHGAITEQVITKHRIRNGIEYLVKYPQFYSDEHSFTPLNEIIRDGVEVFLRNNVGDAREVAIYQEGERLQSPYSINVGFREGLINEDVVSVFLRYSAHLPGGKRIEDAQTYTYDVQKKRLTNLATLVDDNQEFYDSVRDELTRATNLIFEERAKLYKGSGPTDEFAKKQELFFSRNALKNMNFIVVKDGFVFYVPEEVVKTGSLGFLEITHRVDTKDAEDK